jgi:hypothetical protein
MAEHRNDAVNRTLSGSVSDALDWRLWHTRNVALCLEAPRETVSPLTYIFSEARSNVWGEKPTHRSNQAPTAHWRRPHVTYSLYCSSSSLILEA